MNNELRIGNITSSEIVALMSKDRSGKNPGAPYHTYIDECNMERKLGRSLDVESNAHALSWGNLLELRVHDLLGTDYGLYSKKTIVHPLFPFWVGSPDFRHYFEMSHSDAVGDSKCPITLKSFCQLVDPCYADLGFDTKLSSGVVIRMVPAIDPSVAGIGSSSTFSPGAQAILMVRETHRDGDKYYFQLVSNGILLDVSYAELIVYMPYKSELDAIRELATNYDGPEQYRFKWIANAQDDELPHLPDGGYYRNLNVISFPIPDADKAALTERVLMAGNELITIPQLVTV